MGSNHCYVDVIFEVFQNCGIHPLLYRRHICGISKLWYLSIVYKRHICGISKLWYLSIVYKRHICGISKLCDPTIVISMSYLRCFRIVGSIHCYINIVFVMFQSYGI